MDEDQLDRLCWGVDDDGIDTFTPEITCSRMRGKFRSNRRTVPRLPLAAMISRMKLLEDSSYDNGVRGGGRAKLLSERARHLRKPGHSQRKPIERHHQVGSGDASSVGRKIKSKPTYNDHWQEEEFPSLGFEHTVNGSPKKKLKSNDCQSEKQQEDQDEQNVEDTSDEHIPAIDQTEPVVKPRMVGKSNTKAKKKMFDFTKANQSLLEEFPFPQQKAPNVVSLTQHNLEKFLRESDNESSCSAPDPITSEPAKEFEEDDVPLYQKYAVTLDDIMRSRYTQVPFLKGQLATLLNNTTETYHKDPNEYIEKTDAHHLIPEAAADTTDEQIVSAANSTNSVVSELSDLNSPSDNEEEMDHCEQRDIAGLGPVTADTKTEQNIGSGQEDFNVKAEIVQIPRESTDDDKTVPNRLNTVHGCVSSVKIESTHNEVNKEDTRFDDAPSKHAAKNPTHNSGPVSPQGDSMWKLQGKEVIQINGLPAQCDQKVLHDYVRAFGTIKDIEVHTIDGWSSLRFKLESEDACDYAVQCLHDSDCIYPEIYCKLSCEHLQM